ncbi:MAG TPA: nucleotidyl transferase AbiEii/AbiGii toxin family protein [Opitutales bacterium]|nr:nucleotidyl transferase AbiEii/AbiGii toxin family protein [Opitutales bacterium]
MLERADRIDSGDGFSLPVVQIEDIIGLKIQASVNDPRRKSHELADIRMLLETSAEMKQAIDWELLEDYLELFKLEDQIAEIKSWYGTTD